MREGPPAATCCLASAPSLLGSNLRVANHSVADSLESLSPVSTLNCQQACAPNKSRHSPMPLSEISLSHCNPAVHTLLRTQHVLQPLAFPKQQADQHIITKVSSLPVAMFSQLLAASHMHPELLDMAQCRHTASIAILCSCSAMSLLCMSPKPAMCLHRYLGQAGPIQGWPHTTTSSVEVEQH